MATKTTKKAAPVEETAAEATKKETKKTVKKETAAKAETTKAKKTTSTRKTAKAAEPEVSVVFEFAEKQVVAKELLAKAKESFAAAHEDVAVKEIQLYVNANDGFAYLVVNGTEYPEDKIEL